MEELLSKLKRLSIDIKLVDDELRLHIPNDTDGGDIINEVRNNKAALINYIKERRSQSKAPATIGRASEKPYYRLTPPQRGIYFHNQLNSGKSLAYNMPQVFHLEGELQMDKLQEVFVKLINRHESLRTRFVIVGKEPVQEIQKDFEFKLERYEGEVEEIEEIMSRFVRYFDLGNCPLLRVGVVFTKNPKHHLLLVDMHHIISDGTSYQILIKDFADLYNGEQKDELSIQYKDYSEWFHSGGSEMISRQESFWHSAYSQPVSTLELPTDFTRSLERDHGGDSIRFIVAPSEADPLRNLAINSGTTLFTVLLSAYSILLSRLSNQEDIIIGTPTSGRRHHEVQGIMGMFVNTLPVRLQVSGDQDFSSYLEYVNNTVLSCFDNQEYPYELLIDHLDLTRDSSRNPLFDVLFVMQNMESSSISLEGMQISSYQWGQKASKFDISFSVKEDSTGFYFEIEYATGLFEKSTIEKFRDYYLRILSLISANPSISVAEIDIIDAEESSRLLSLHDRTGVNYPEDETLVSIFEKQAENTPEKIAVSYEGQDYSYEDINNRSNALAEVLRSKGVGREHIVGLLLPRGVDVVVGMLGILKSGGAYMPIDPDYPESRISYILEDSQCGHLVTLSQYTSYGTSGHYTCIDKEVVAQPVQNLERINAPEDLCYIIYTSGTTGKPKGVCVEHRNVVRLLFNDSFQFDFGTNDVWTMFHSHCFDFSVWELYGALLYGGKLVVISRTDAIDPERYLQILKDYEVTVVNQTPTAFYNLIHKMEATNVQLDSLRYVIFGGEALSPVKLSSWSSKNPHVKLINMFGITETTVHVTFKELGEEDFSSQVSNIGSPIPTSSVYILDEHMRPVPYGVKGEMYVGGLGVSRGYLNKPELTSLRFVPNPYREEERLYRTGDLARILPSGDIEYLGRSDSQVQLRGFRIELGEIEYHLSHYPSISNATVVISDVAGNKALCAYYVCKSEVVTEELRDYLKSHVPHYMIPSYFIELENMPLTHNDKIDIEKLPVPEVSGDFGRALPRDAREIQLVNIWEKELAVEGIGISDNFFSLGGDSLKAIALIYEINSQMGSRLTISDLYTHQTIEGLSPLLDRNQVTSSYYRSKAMDEISAFQNFYKNEVGWNDSYEAVYPMSGIEKGMVYYSLKHEPGETDIHKILYHEQNIYDIPLKDFDFELFKHAVSLLVEKHPDFKKIYDLNYFAHIVKKEIEPEIHYIDISEMSYEDQENYVLTKMDTERKRATELSASLLWRMHVIKTKPDFHFLLFDMHHSLLDGWSLQSFITELNNTYAHLVNDRTYKPAPLACSFEDHIISEISETMNEQSKAYWKEELEGYTRIKFEKKRDEHAHAYKRYFLGEEMREALAGVAADQNTSIKHLCFAAYIYSIQMLSYSKDILVGITTNNRPLVPDSEKMFGCFLNTIPFRVKIESDQTWGDFINLIEGKLRKSKNPERIPLRGILDIIGENSQGENPLFDTLFNFTDFRILKEMLALRDTEGPQDMGFDIDYTSYMNPNTLCDFHITPNYNFQMDISYSTAYFDEESIEKLYGYFKNTLDCFIHSINSSMSNTRVLAINENTAMDSWSTAGSSVEGSGTMLDDYEKQVKKSPKSLAVGSVSGNLTFGEFDNKVNQLSHYLKSEGVHKGDVVAVMLPRSPEMLASIYAVLKLGAIYLPMDANNPVKRNEHILSDSSVKFLISSGEVDEDLHFSGGVVDLSHTNLERYPTDHPGTHVTPDDTAYIIYTSGSTGLPKGVPIRHESLHNNLRWMQKNYPLTTADKVLHKTTITFDVSCWELFWWSVSGASIHILPEGEERDSNKISQVIEGHGITFVQFVPSVLSYFLEYVKDNTHDFSSLKRVVSCGEALPVSVVNTFKKLLHKPFGIDLFNLYGPTEATIHVTYHDCMSNQITDTVPIGKPIDNTSIYILDENNQLLPHGVIGELCIGGVSVSSGYINRPELNEKVFINDPFAEGGKLYKTGDLAYRNEEGDLCYVDRKDNQIKIRGFRIELGEIENQLEAISGVDKAIVTVVVIHGSQEELVAAIICPDNTSRPANYYQDKLRKFLPEYMIPTHFIKLEKSELTRHGKFDRKTFIEYINKIEIGKQAYDDYVPPSNDIENKLVDIWSDVLNLEKDKIGVQTSFFELGGHSLRAVTLISRINREFKRDIPLQLLFEIPTIREITLFLTALTNNSDERMDLADSGDDQEEYIF